MSVIKIIGTEKLAAQLKALGGVEERVVLERAAERLRDRVVPGVPVDSGALRDSSEIVVGDKEVRLQWDRLPYAGPVEARRPFLEPVAESEGPEIVKDEFEIAQREAVGDD